MDALNFSGFMPEQHVNHLGLWYNGLLITFAKLIYLKSVVSGNLSPCPNKNLIQIYGLKCNNKKERINIGSRTLLKFKLLAFLNMGTERTCKTFNSLPTVCPHKMLF